MTSTASDIEQASDHAFPLEVAGLMNSAVECCERDSELLPVAQRMRDERIGCIVVTENIGNGPSPVGLITDRDLTTKVVAADIAANAVTAGDVMSSPAVTVRRNSPISEAIDLMSEHNIKRLAVVDPVGCLCGIVSADDILRALAFDVNKLTTSLHSIVDQRKR